MKKLISILISLLLITTIISSSSVAFAQDIDTNNYTENIGNTNDNINDDLIIDDNDNDNNDNDNEGKSNDDDLENPDEPEEKIAPTDVRLSRVNINYSATPQRPIVTAYYNNEALIYNEDFTVDFSNWQSTYPGTYKVYVNFIGKYEGTIEKTYTILPQKNIKINLSSSTFTINNKVQRPLVTITDNKGNKLTYKKDFIVNYSNWSSTNVGRYTVTIELLGKYACVYTMPYYINPKPISFVSSANGGFKSGIGSFSLKWNKNTYQTTGYELQYATKKDFSNNASVIINDLNQTSITINNRANGRRYYVRIRAFKKIDNGTFYSNWDYTGNYVKSVVTAEPYNSNQAKMVNVAQNYYRYGIVARYGYCEGWVADVYQANYGDVTRVHCAICAGRRWSVSRDFSQIQVGAAIYGYSHNPYGHVGIYIGQGRIIHNINGQVKTDSIESWIANYNGVCWGWENGNNLTGNRKYDCVGNLI